MAYWLTNTYCFPLAWYICESMRMIQRSDDIWFGQYIFQIYKHLLVDQYILLPSNDGILLCQVNAYCSWPAKHTGWSTHIASLKRRHIEQTYCCRPSVYWYFSAYYYHTLMTYWSQIDKHNIALVTLSKYQKRTYLWNESVWGRSPPVACMHQILSPSVVNETSDAEGGGRTQLARHKCIRRGRGHRKFYFS